MPPIDYLSIPECAIFLGVTTTEVEALVADKVLWSHHWGAEIMVSQRHAELWREGKLRRPGKKVKESPALSNEKEA
ncbi:MAG: hypothetical protein K1Y36_26110 [Blastocatellia bacterium]|nr:hypothetical protein [Blastocatellia bacterium]